MPEDSVWAYAAAVVTVIALMVSLLMHVLLRVYSRFRNTQQELCTAQNSSTVPLTLVPNGESTDRYCDEVHSEWAGQCVFASGTVTNGPLYTTAGPECMQQNGSVKDTAILLQTSEKCQYFIEVQPNTGMIVMASTRPITPAASLAVSLSGISTIVWLEFSGPGCKNDMKMIKLVLWKSGKPVAAYVGPYPYKCKLEFMIQEWMKSEVSFKYFQSATFYTVYYYNSQTGVHVLPPGSQSKALYLISKTLIKILPECKVRIGLENVIFDPIKAIKCSSGYDKLEDVTIIFDNEWCNLQLQQGASYNTLTVCNALNEWLQQKTIMERKVVPWLSEEKYNSIMSASNPRDSNWMKPNLSHTDDNLHWSSRDRTENHLAAILKSSAMSQLWKTTYCLKSRSDCKPIKTKIIPAKPSKPRALTITHDSVLLEWNKPNHDNFKLHIIKPKECIILSYTVHYCCIIDQSKSLESLQPSPAQWTETNTSSPTEKILVSNLSNNCTYVFKIQPRYKNGVGIESISDYITTKSTSKPGKPQPIEVTSCSIKLQWKKPDHGVSNITSYIVLYRCSKDAPDKWNERNTGSITNEMLIPKLSEKTEYYFKILPHCINGSGLESDLSEPITTAIIIPGKPGKPTAQGIDSTSVHLAWTKPVLGAYNITSYTVLINSCHEPNDQWTEFKTNSPEPIVLVPDLVANSKYSFKIRPECEVGSGVKSDISEPIVMPPSKPGKPTALNVTHERVKLKWTKPKLHAQNVQYYTVLYNFTGDSDDQWQELKTTTPQTTLSVSNLIEGTEYYFKIRPECKVGSGVESDTSEPIVMPPSKPGKPTALNVTHERVKLKWTKPKLHAQNVQYYTVLYNFTGDSDDQWQELKTTTPQTKLSISNLIEGTEYYFKIRPECKVGSGVESDTSEPIVMLPSKPGKPTALNVTHEHVKLKWTKPKLHAQNIQYYAVLYNFTSNSDDQWKELKTTTPQTKLSISNLIEGTEYYFKIRPECKVGSGVESDTSEPIVMPPSKPGKPTALNVTHERVELQWTKPKLHAHNVQYYTVLYNFTDDSDDQWQELKTTTRETKLSISNLIESTEYYFKVRAECIAGTTSGIESDTSESITTKLITPGQPGKPVAYCDMYHEGIQLKWAESEEGAHNITSYTIFYRSSVDPKDEWMQECILTKKPQCHLKKLPHDCTYYFKVQANFKEGVGKQSDISDPVANKKLLNRELSLNDLGFVQEMVWNARVKWYNLGLSLKVDVGDLEAIKKTCLCQTDDCFREMLMCWLRKKIQGEKKTLKEITDALQNKSVSRVDVANLIIKECSGTDVNGINPERSEIDSTVKRISFRCPCGDCSIGDFLQRCPKLSNSYSDARFPYLDIEHLTQTDKLRLYMKLNEETRAIMDEFANLVKDVRDSFREENVDVRELKSIVEDKFRHTTIIQPCATDSMPSNSVNDITNFLQQKKYVSFFNYQLMEVLIQRYGTEFLKEKLKEYKSKFKKFCQRSIFEVPENAIKSDVPSGSEMLMFKVTKKLENSVQSERTSAKMTSEPFNNLSGEGVMEIKGMIGKALGLDPANLTFHYAAKGCIELTFYLPEIIMSTVKEELDDLKPQTLDRENLPHIIMDDSVTDEESLQLGIDESCLVSDLQADNVHISQKIRNDPQTFGKVRLGPLPSQLSKPNLNSRFCSLERSGIHIKCGPPGKPFAAQVTCASVNLQWTQPEYQGFHPILYYCVHYRSDTDPPELSRAIQTDDSKKIIEIGRLSSEKSPFIFRVRGINKVGAGIESEPSDLIYLLKEKSDDVGCSTEDHSRDKRPLLSKPRVTSVSYNSVQLQWTKPTKRCHQITSYAVLYQPECLSDHSEWVEQKVSRESMIVTNLLEKTTYYFKIRLECTADCCLESEISEPVSTLMIVPSKPGKPRAVCVTECSIELTWTKPEQGAHNVIAYIVYYNSLGGVPTQIKTTKEGALISNLSETTIYYFKVQPVSECAPRNRPMSNISEPIKTKEIIPSQPGKPIVLSVTHDSIELEWSKPLQGAHNVVFYTMLYRSTDDSQWMKKKATKECIQISQLLEKTAYYFKVQPECESGAGVQSETSGPTMTKAIVPSQPGKPTASKITLNSIQLEWTKPKVGADKVTSYTVCYSSTLSSGKWKETTVDCTQHSVVMTELQQGTTYMFKIRPEYYGTNYGVESEISDPITTKLVLPLKPGKPMASCITSSSIELVWTKPEGNMEQSLLWTKPEHTFINNNVIFYTISYNSTHQPSVWMRTTSTEEKILVSGLSEKTTYCFLVQAEYEYGIGLESKSDPITTKMILPSKPGKPTAFDVTCNSIHLEWTEPEQGACNISLYTIFYRHDDDPPDQWIEQKTSNNDIKFILSQLKEETTYYFKVTPECEDGSGLESEISEAIITKMVVPGRPGKPKVSISLGSQNKVQVEWTKPEIGTHNIIAYVISYRALEESSNQWRTERVSNLCHMTIIDELKPNSTFVFKISTDTKNGFGPESELSDHVKIEKSLAQIVKESPKIGPGHDYPGVYRDKHKMDDKQFKGHNDTQKITIGVKTIERVLVPVERKSYELPIQEIMRTEVSGTTVAKYVVDIGDTKAVNKQSQEKVFMLVGGLEKDRVINSMANYILGVHWENDFRYELDLDDLESQITICTLYPKEGSRISYSLTLVNTPTVDTTSYSFIDDDDGNETNKDSLRMIRNFFYANKKIIDHVHGIGVVMDRFDDGYIFDSILTMFGEDILFILAETDYSDVEEFATEPLVNFKEKFFPLCTNLVDTKELWKEKLSGFRKFFTAIECIKPKKLTTFQKKLHKMDPFLSSGQCYPFFKSDLGIMSKLNSNEPCICKSTSITDTAPGTSSIPIALIEPGTSQFHEVRISIHLQVDTCTCHDNHNCNKLIRFGQKEVLPVSYRNMGIINSYNSRGF